TGGNNKATADQLYIHVNTLYYRINKIEQILNIDLAKMNARVELYTAIKVWDTLQVLNGKEEIAAVQPVPMAMQA
ncbi:MAG TPA: helix-turn-helix domain-containing protein, partial [Syntrophomonas sp.]|nr:helix-turn-helix domain-containing protein [Syntrophomonas sp.]